MFRVNTISATVFFAILTFFSGIACAATVSPEKGSVLVNKGTGFVALSATVAVQPGYQIMVRPGGVALLSYANGCTTRIGSGRLWIVQDKPECDGKKVVDLTGAGRMNAQGDEDETATSSAATPLVLLGVAGAVAGAIILIRANDDKSASP